MDRPPSTKGKVLKRDVSFVAQPTRQHDGEPVFENIFCGSLYVIESYDQLQVVAEVNGVG